MFLILSIHSKNLSSLTNFLKLFYKLKINKTLKIKFYATQSQQNKKFSFFSTLQSPHVNKRSQEQFGYFVYTKKLKIHVSQITKFLIIWKIVKTTIFSDIKMQSNFWVQNKSLKAIFDNKLDYDKFKLKFVKKIPRTFASKNHFKKTKWSSVLVSTSLKLLDAHGEALMMQQKSI